MNKKLIFFSLIILISISFAYAYNLKDVLSGRVSLVDILTGKAVSEAKGFTSQGTWLKSWIPNLKSVYNGDILIGDFNGDGKTDIGVYDAVNGNWMIANSNGNGFDATGVWLKSWLPKRDYGEGNTFTGDFNGDGKTDIGVYDSINGNWLVALSDGVSFSTKTQGWLSGWLPKSSYGEGNTFTGDFNGDGKTDIGVYDAIQGNWIVALSTGTSFDAKGKWLKSWLSGYSGNTFTGDFNGDGKTDIGVYDSINGNWLVATSNGTDFIAKHTWLKSWLPKSSYGEGNMFTGDFNGDKKTDIGVYDAIHGNWLVALASEPVILTDTGGVYSSGGGFSTKTQGWLSGWLPKSSYGEGNTFTGDFNGDGKTDIGVYDSMNGNWLVALATSTPSYCVDTDNGAVYTKKGNVYGVELGNAFDKADYCLNSTLIREYYCHGANAVISDYNCPYGCSSGICNATATTNETQATCTDSDNGQNFYTQGNVTTKSISSTDICLDSTRLREFFCTSTNDIEYIVYNCSDGCSDGVCLQKNVTLLNVTCTDSDNGLDYYTKGTTQNSTTTKTDSCWENGQTLIEYDCSGNRMYQTNYQCLEGCIDGACIVPLNGFEIGDPCIVDLSKCSETEKSNSWRNYNFLEGIISEGLYTNKYGFFCMVSTEGFAQAWPVVNEPGWWCGDVLHISTEEVSKSWMTQVVDWFNNLFA